MSSPFRLAATLCVAIVVSDAAGIARATTGAADAACKGPNEVPASALADSALLHGPWHKVAPCARVAGHLAHFRISSDFGPMTATGVEMLAIRVDEMHAIAQLDAVNPGGLAWDAARDRGTRTGAQVHRVVRHPIATLKGLPSGVWRFLRGKVESIARESRKLADKAADGMTDADEAYDDVVLRPGASPPAAGTRDPWWQRNGDRVERRAKRYLGYPDLRRTWARRLQVDPYSSNDVLDARMDTLAWAALAGDRSARYTIGLIDGGVGEVLSTTRELNDMVWDLPAAKVNARNAARLAAYGCGEIEVRRFLRNSRFSPSVQTGVVDALSDLQPIAGCVDMMEIGASLENEIEARYFRNALRMLAERVGNPLPDARAVSRIAPAVSDIARRDDNDGPLEIEIRDGRAVDPLRPRALVLIGTAPVLREPDGTLVLPLAVDRLQWTAATRAFFDLRAFDAPRKTVLIAGDATPRALRALSDRGWRVERHVAYPGAPPYPVDHAATRVVSR